MQEDCRTKAVLRDRLVREHAAWALGRVASPSARQALSRASASEDDPFVQEELRSIASR